MRAAAADGLNRKLVREGTKIPRLVKPNDAVLQGKDVRVIGRESDQLGVMPVDEALEKAAEEQLDLVLVAGKSEPPVCRMMDFGKFRYEQKRRQKDQKKKQHQQRNKEIKFRVNTDQHDYKLKIEHVIAFLQKGYKVRVSLQFRGREMSHRQLGIERLQQVIEDIGEQAHVDSPPRMSGRIVSAQLTPASGPT